MARAAAILRGEVGDLRGALLVFAAYEYAVPKPSLDDNWNAVRSMSPRIAEIYDAGIQFAPEAQVWSEWWTLEIHIFWPLRR